MPGASTNAMVKRLEELGVDPLESLVRIAMRAEAAGNLALAQKTWSDLMAYTAPKLKSMEVSIEPGTMQFLDRQQRLNRIESLLRQIGHTQAADIIEGSCQRLDAPPAQE